MKHFDDRKKTTFIFTVKVIFIHHHFCVCILMLHFENASTYILRIFRLFNSMKEGDLGKFCLQQRKAEEKLFNSLILSNFCIYHTHAHTKSMGLVYMAL